MLMTENSWRRLHVPSAGRSHAKAANPGAVKDRLREPREVARQCEHPLLIQRAWVGFPALTPPVAPVPEPHCPLHSCQACTLRAGQAQTKCSYA